MPKVLIAEDEPIIADMIAEVLAESGYDICGIARSVSEAIELGEAHRPDLAVIDLHLADGGIGTEIGRRLRRQGSLGVLYMTGGAHEITLTADDGEACLRKPFALTHFVSALKIVERIVTPDAAATAFPPGFEVLRHPLDQRMPEGAETAAANLKITRLLRQQAALAGFGGFAFRETDLEKILTEAARACAECLDVPFCKICRYRHEENDLLVEAGFGWQPGVIGSVVSRADQSSPQGRAFITGEPVICDDLSRDSAFTLPALYADHCIVSIVDVIIKGNGKPYGVLEIDSPEPHSYDRHDVDFLTGFANVLAEAVGTTKRNKLLRSAVGRMKNLVADKDRLLTENNLILIEKNRLLEEKSVLARELHHRVRNNLQLVYAMLCKQREQAADGSVKDDISAIARRVMTLAKMHDHLLGTGLSRTIDIGDYLRSLCAGYAELEAAGGCDIGLTCHFEPLVLDLDIVTVLGLVTAELISNSYRHAFPNGKGTISISLQQSLPPDEATITFRDDGVSFADNRDGNRHGLGLVDRLMEQIRGSAEVRSDHGTAWILRFPLHRDGASRAPLVNSGQRARSSAPTAGQSPQFPAPG
jgi:two-component sensor histidine kinase